MEQNRIFQFDGAFSKRDTDEETDETCSEIQEVLESYIEDLSEEFFRGDVCSFKTLHKNGLKVHVERKHKVKCDKCRDQAGMTRHIKAKNILEITEDKEMIQLKLKITFSTLVNSEASLN